jgi:hypothetical protein
MSNVCNCPKPPGGHVTCSDNQLAVCGYRKGQIVSGCYDPPEHAALIKDEERRTLVVANWAVSMITGIGRQDDDAFDFDLFEMLMSGRYKDEATGEIITFGLPSDVELQGNIRVPVPFGRLR